MQLASVITPFSEENLKLAAQVGVSNVTIRYPGNQLQELLATKQLVEQQGLKIGAIEGYLPMENIKLGNDQFEDDMAEMKTLLRNMATAGIPILCYNFMAGTDWVRTRVDVPARGGAWVTEFNLEEVHRAISLDTNAPKEVTPISATELWQNLERFLKEILPVAEELNITLAMHPDDPPLESFLGRDRIMNSVENFERLVELVPSPANAICFCQGTFAEMGAEIPTTIRQLGKHIQYVHCRDIKGTRENFQETFHDNGPTNMYEAIKAYREIGFDGPIRPDHVPQLVGDEQGEPGYTMQGRLFAFGYLRGLIQAAQQEQ